MISRLYNDWLKSTVSYNNFTLLVLSNIYMLNTQSQE